MKKHLLSVSYHSTLPQNTGSSVRIRNLLLNLRELKPILLAPEPVDVDLLQRAFVPFEVPAWVRRRLPFNAAILGCCGSRVYRRSKDLLSDLAVTVVQSEHLWSFPLARRIAQGLGVPIVLVEHNIETVYVQRAYHAPMLQRAVAVLERWALQQSDRVVVCSQEDARILAERFGTPQEKIWVIPNGIHVPTIAEERISDGIPEPLRNKTLALFLGKTTYPPNADAIRIIRNELAPRIRAQDSDIVFVIVGGPEEADYSGLENGVVFTGFLENLHPLLRCAKVAIAPLTSGSGTRLKILEYAAHAKPIVATSVAVEGLGFTHGREILIANEWDDFANSILSIAHGERNGEALGRAAYGRVVEEYQWKSIAARYEQLLQGLVGLSGDTDGSRQQ